MSIKQRIIRFFVLSAIGLTIGAGIAGLSILAEKQDTRGSAIEFHLINQDGKDVSEKDFVGKYMLVYFGFTSCPAICPTELQKMTEAFQSLSAETRKHIQPVFITVDPARDTLKVIAGYVDLFMPELIGLTGDDDQIGAAKRAFRVYASKVEDGDTYTMDHSSFIYFITPDRHIAAMFKTADKPDDIKTRIVGIIGKN